MDKEKLKHILETRVYLGDSVYAHHDGYQIILTTHNGYADDPRNTIALEPILLEALDAYRAKINNAIKEYRNAGNV